MLTDLKIFENIGCKDLGLKEGNELRHSQVPRMGRNNRTEKSHY